MEYGCLSDTTAKFLKMDNILSGMISPNINLLVCVVYPTGFLKMKSKLLTPRQQNL